MCLSSWSTVNQCVDNLEFVAAFYAIICSMDWYIRLCLVVRSVSLSVNVVMGVMMVLVESAVAAMILVMQGSSCLV